MTLTRMNMNTVMGTSMGILMSTRTGMIRAPGATPVVDSLRELADFV